MPVFDSNCLYIIQCLALVFLAAPCVLFAGGMLICGLLWCGLRITRAEGKTYGYYVALHEPRKG